MLMAWLDRFVEWDWTALYLIWLLIRFREDRQGFGPISLQKQNMGSVFIVYTVDRRHWVRFFGTWQILLLPIFSYNRRLTGQGLGRLGKQEDVDPLPSGWQGSLCRRLTNQGPGRPGSLCMWLTGQGPGRPSQLWEPFSKVLFTMFWRTLGRTLITLFGLIWLYVRMFWADVLHGYSDCIWIQPSSIYERYETTGYPPLYLCTKTVV